MMHISLPARAKARLLMAMLMEMRTMPSASASARLPLLVSSTMVVVMVRVTPAMLPPTMMMAPTSEMARPNPASSAVSTGRRPISSNCGMALRRVAPRIWNSWP